MALDDWNGRLPDVYRTGKYQFSPPAPHANGNGHAKYANGARDELVWLVPAG